jgi:hypothetical protein
VWAAYIHTKPYNTFSTKELSTASYIKLNII